MDKLTLVSCLGENTYPICTLLAEHLSASLGLECHFDTETPWQQACGQLATGHIPLGWICGLLYTQQQDATPTGCYRILGKPVFSGQTSATYHAKLVVHRDSPYQQIHDLHGKRLVINEPGSYSGNHALWAWLAGLPLTPPHFACVLESGSHAASLRMLAQGEADLAAIDHTVFGYWQASGGAERQAIMQSLRVIGQTADAPAPPWLMHRSVPAELFARLQTLLLGLHQTALAPTLRAAGLERIVPATDSDYDPLRAAYQRSLHLQASLKPQPAP